MSNYTITTVNTVFWRVIKMNKNEIMTDQVPTVEQYKEWLLLILEAKKIGLQPNEIREFLRNSKSKSRKC